MHQFRSRVSVVLVICIIGFVVPAFFLGEPNSSPYFAYGILGLTVFGLLAVLFSVRYEITETHLKIRIGPFDYGIIEIRSIEKVERSYNPLSSPSGSLKRLYIKGKDVDTLISPANEAEFIRLLKAKNPSIEVKTNDKKSLWHFWNWDI